jgi:hypothetical protein
LNGEKVKQKTMKQTKAKRSTAKLDRGGGMRDERKKKRRRRRRRRRRPLDLG